MGTHAGTVSLPAVQLYPVIHSIKGAVRAIGAPVMRAALAGRPALAPDTWGLTVDPQRGLCAEGIGLRDLLTRWGSPLHVVLAERLSRNVAAIGETTDGAPACELFYSCKTNPVAGVLELLRAQGAGVEVASPYELWLAQRVGFRPDRIIYNGPAKSEASLREAVARDVLLINVNHAEEVALLARIACEVGRRPRVGIRVAMPGGWSGQFGVPIDQGAALAAYGAALDSGVLDVVGLHAHRGTLIRTRDDLFAFADAVLDFVDELHATLGLSLRIVDFGGGLAVPTVDSVHPRARRLNWLFGVPLPAPDPARTLSLGAYARELSARVRARARRGGWPVPRIVVETGRAMTADTQLLLASVVALNRSNGRTWAILDAGINVAEPVQHEYHQLFALRPEREAEAPYVVTGPICSPADVLYPAARLPALRPGDGVAIMDSGAYFVPFANSFSFPRPGIVLVRDGQDVLLRRAERYDDLTALDV